MPQTEKTPQTVQDERKEKFRRAGGATVAAAALLGTSLYAVAYGEINTGIVTAAGSVGLTAFAYLEQMGAIKTK